MESLQETLRMDPSFRSVHSLIGQVYLGKSMYEEALAEFNKEKELFGSGVLDTEFFIGITYIKMGKREEAKQIQYDLIERSKKGHDVLYFIANLYFALGDNDLGFEWLNKAYEEQDSWLSYLKIDPSLDEVRSDSRFKALLNRVGWE